jgi:hypothetical protein
LTVLCEVGIGKVANSHILAVAGPLAMHPDVPAIGHFDTVFLSFLQANVEMVPRFRVATAYFSCNPQDLNLLQLYQSAVKASRLYFQIIQFTVNSENENPAAPASSHCF